MELIIPARSLVIRFQYGHHYIMESTENKDLGGLKPEKPSIKDNWLKKDILCEKCGQVVYRQKGITKQSIKRLFSFDIKKDWLITVLMIGVLLLVWAYKNDKAAYADFMEHRMEYCTKLLSNVDNAYGNEELDLNWTNENETDIGNGFNNPIQWNINTR